MKWIQWLLSVRCECALSRDPRLTNDYDFNNGVASNTRSNPMTHTKKKEEMYNIEEGMNAPGKPKLCFIRQRKVAKMPALCVRGVGDEGMASTFECNE